MNGNIKQKKKKIQNKFFVTGNVTGNILYIGNKGRLLMCTPYVRKEANRLNWLVKGSLINRSESDKTVEHIYESYFKRLWNNTERSEYGAIGFEAAYKAREAEIINEKK